MKIAIYGTGETTEKFLEKISGHSDVYITAFVETTPKDSQYQSCPLIAPADIPWFGIDALVICSDIYHEAMMETLRKLSAFEINKGKVVKHDHFFSTELARIRKMMPFQSCAVEDGKIIYIARSQDEIIPLEMFQTGRNWAWEEMEAFIELTKEHYGKKNRGVFLDIGANIGTTSIYMKKRLPELDVIGFELTKENHMVFRMNCIANEADDIVAENLGLSDDDGFCGYHYVSFNSGGSGINSQEGETDVKKRTLDSYLHENGIVPENLYGIWMDVEGHECNVIKGAESCLNAASFPLFMEFSPKAYKENDFADFVTIMSRNYRGFIDIRDYIAHNKRIRTINELADYKEVVYGKGRLQTDLFFVC